MKEWHDAQGRTGIDYTLSLIARLLQPTQSESGGLLVGDLIIRLIKQGGDTLHPDLPALVNAMINRMPTTQTSSFVQVSRT